MMVAALDARTTGTPRLVPMAAVKVSPELTVVAMALAVTVALGMTWIVTRPVAASMFTDAIWDSVRPGMAAITADLTCA